MVFYLLEIVVIHIDKGEEYMDVLSSFMWMLVINLLERELFRNSLMKLLYLDSQPFLKSDSCLQLF